ncbi:MAG: sugar transferase [Cyanobacteria bacterium P01_H01_bin.121]
MATSPKQQLYKKLFDIRAPRRFSVAQLSYWQNYRTLTLVLLDVIALALAWQVATYLNQFHSPIPEQLIWWRWLGVPSPSWLLSCFILLAFIQANLYGAGTHWKNYLRTAQAVSLVYLGSLVLSYFHDPTLDLPRSLFFSAWFSSIIFVVLLRLIATLVLTQLEVRQGRVAVFLIAHAEELPILSRKLEARARYRVVGASLTIMAHSENTLQAILDSKAREVLVAHLPPTELASQLYWRLRRHHITLRLLPTSVNVLHRRGLPEVFAGFPTLRVTPPFLNGWEYRLKRYLDYVAACLGLIALIPVFVGIAIAIQINSPGPVFYRQSRVGLHGKVFQMWKFRTMYPNAEQLQASLEAQNQGGDVLFKLKRDPRIIKTGHFLRRTSLDELPQLFNVLMGQMSLVGPRPLPTRDVERFDAWHHTRHQVLPGITGLWQVSGRSEIDDFDDAARLDLYYIDNWSFNLDLEILVETVRVILFRQGSY